MLTHFLNENQYIFLHPPITNTNLSSIPFIGIQSTKLLSWDKQTDEKSLLHFMDTPSLDTDKYLLPAVVKVSSEKDLTKITTHFPGQQLRQFKLITDACNLPYPPAPFRDKWTGTAFYLLILPPSWLQHYQIVDI